MMTNMNQHVDPKSLQPRKWSVAEAKARFSEVVARAKAGQPQRVTRYGKDEVMVVSVADWQAAKGAAQTQNSSDQPGGLLELFAPLMDSGVVLERMQGGLRPDFGEGK